MRHKSQQILDVIRIFRSFIPRLIVVYHLSFFLVRYISIVASYHESYNLPYFLSISMGNFAINFRKSFEIAIFAELFKHFFVIYLFICN